MPVYNREWMDYDSVTVWRIKKNNTSKKWTYDYPEFMQHINREGFNDINHDFEKKPGVKRIMIIGDSYTAGLDYPIDKIFTGIVQQKLNEKFPNKYEVMNCAVPAWSIEQEYSYFIHEGTKYKPDYVLLMVAPNDIREAYTRNMLSVHGDTVEPWIVNPMTKKEKLVWKFAAHSSFSVCMQKKHLLPASTFESMLWKYFSRSFPDFPADSAWDEPLFLKQWSWQQTDAGNRFKVLLYALEKECRGINAELIVSIIPTKTEFDNTLADTSKYEPGKVAHWLDTVCASKKIPYYPIFEEAQKVENKMELYQYWEFHLDPDGHKFMGEKLAEFLEKQIK